MASIGAYNYIDIIVRILNSILLLFTSPSVTAPLNSEMLTPSFSRHAFAIFSMLISKRLLKNESYDYDNYEYSSVQNRATLFGVNSGGVGCRLFMMAKLNNCYYSVKNYLGIFPWCGKIYLYIFIYKITYKN